MNRSPTAMSSPRRRRTDSPPDRDLFATQIRLAQMRAGFLFADFVQRRIVPSREFNIDQQTLDSHQRLDYRSFLPYPVHDSGPGEPLDPIR
jgi:hypothetical protein